MRQFSYALLAIIVIVFSASTSTASPSPEPIQWKSWAADAEYDPDIPDLDTFLERPFAAQHSTVDEIIEYAFLLTEKSPRVSIEIMGESVQGDPLTLLVITSPENYARIGDRTERLDFVRDAWKNDEAERLRVADEMLPVTWIACSVHGDEASGSDAGLALAYHLAADQSAKTTEVLENSIVLIGLSHNPDGRRRFLQHVRSFGRAQRAPDDSPWASEHSQMWPGGRTNHFLFDLNRDWAFLTQQETRAHVAAFLRWRPQVFVDLHEMYKDSSYFFPPPAEPINPNIPREHLAWFDVFGKANGEAFDSQGFDYFVKESFDLFYPGYGDSWPTLQGAVGMTFEQATTRGRWMRQLDGRILGYGDAVQRHFVAALTTVETAARQSDALLDSYVEFHSTMRKRAKADPRTELILSTAKHEAEATRLIETLARQGISAYRTTEDARVKLASYDDPSAAEKFVDLPAGSYRIPLAQPAYALVRSLLDPDTPMDPAFLEQERERKTQGLKSRFYDVTAWSLIYSYGLQAHVARRSLDVPAVLVQPDLMPVTRVKPVSEASARTAWAIPYMDNGSIAALIALWAEGVQVSCSLEAFEQQGTVFPRGSFLVKRSTNQDIADLDVRVQRAAASVSVEVHALDSSWSDSGVSLGSNKVLLLEQPRVGLLTGPGVSPSSGGGLNWLLEERYGISFTTLMMERLEHVDLSDFDVLLVPELARGRELPVKNLASWVESGGYLILIGSAAASIVPEAGTSEKTEGARKAEREWTTVERISDLALLTDDDGLLGDEKIGQADPASYAGPLPPERRPLRTPGAILELDLDTAHYLTFGEEGTIYAPVLSDRLLTPSVGGKTVANINAENPRRAGFIWPVMEEALKGKAYLVEEQRGRGRVLLFAEDPGFRGTWEGLHRLLLNGVLIGSSIAR